MCACMFVLVAYLYYLIWKKKSNYSSEAKESLDLNETSNFSQQVIVITLMLFLLCLIHWPQSVSLFFFFLLFSSLLFIIKPKIPKFIYF